MITPGSFISSLLIIGAVRYYPGAVWVAIALFAVLLALGGIVAGLQWLGENTPKWVWKGLCAAASVACFAFAIAELVNPHDAAPHGIRNFAAVYGVLFAIYPTFPVVRFIGCLLRWPLAVGLVGAMFYYGAVSIYAGETYGFGLVLGAALISLAMGAQILDPSRRLTGRHRFNRIEPELHPRTLYGEILPPERQPQ